MQNYKKKFLLDPTQFSLMINPFSLAYVMLECDGRSYATNSASSDRARAGSGRKMADVGLDSSV